MSYLTFCSFMHDVHPNDALAILWIYFVLYCKPPQLYVILSTVYCVFHHGPSSKISDPHNNNIIHLAPLHLDAQRVQKIWKKWEGNLLFQIYRQSFIQTFSPIKPVFKRYLVGIILIFFLSVFISLLILFKHKSSIEVA